MTSPGNYERDEELDAQLNRQVHRSRRLVWAFVAGLAALVLALTGAVTYLIVVNSNEAANNKAQIIAAQEASDHRWCTVLQLITSVPQSPPANPAANPSREANYQFYRDFLSLRRQFDCD